MSKVFTYWLASGFDWIERVDTFEEAIKWAFSAEVMYLVTEDRSERPYKITGNDAGEDLAQALYHARGPQTTFPPILLDYLDNTQRGLVDSAQGRI